MGVDREIGRERERDRETNRERERDRETNRERERDKQSAEVERNALYNSQPYSTILFILGE